MHHTSFTLQSFLQHIQTVDTVQENSASLAWFPGGCCEVDNFRCRAKIFKLIAVSKALVQHPSPLCMSSPLCSMLFPNSLRLFPVQNAKLMMGYQLQSSPLQMQALQQTQHRGLNWPFSNASSLLSLVHHPPNHQPNENSTRSPL